MIHHEAIPAFSQSQYRRNMRCFQQQMAQQGLVQGLGGADAGDWLLGHNQDMYRRLRVDVMKGQDQVVLISKLRRNLPGNDFFEECHGGSLPARLARRNRKVSHGVRRQSAATTALWLKWWMGLRLVAFCTSEPKRSRSLLASALQNPRYEAAPGDHLSPITT